MKKTILLLTTFFVALTSCKTQQDPAQKEAQKIQKEAERTALYLNALSALEDMDFVIEADRINFKGGQSIYVNSTTNFISVADKNSVIQLAFNSPYAGPNGIGGITVNGTISNVKKTTDKKGNVNFSMSVLGVAVSADVFFTLVKGSNTVTATVSPNFSSNNITFTGYLVPKSQAKIYKGNSL